MSKLIKLYGERNTNTNYLEKLIQLNLDVKQVPGVVPSYVKTMQKVLPGKEWLRDYYFSVTCDRNLVWKHTRVMSSRELKRYDILARGICFVSVTKNPYAWLLSLHRRPYSHQFSAGKPDFETFLKTPWKTVARDNTDKQLNSPIELWNIKNRSYLQLTDFNGMNITTESMVENPESVINSIGRHFSIARPSPDFRNYDQSTKDESKDFAYYQHYYVNEKWREDLSQKAIATINQSVDRNLMAHFDYRVL
jgi:hypothetical protein